MLSVVVSLFWFGLVQIGLVVRLCARVLALLMGPVQDLSHLSLYDSWDCFQPLCSSPSRVLRP